MVESGARAKATGLVFARSRSLLPRVSNKPNSSHHRTAHRDTHMTSNYPRHACSYHPWDTDWTACYPLPLLPYAYTLHIQTHASSQSRVPASHACSITSSSSLIRADSASKREPSAKGGQGVRRHGPLFDRDACGGRAKIRPGRR